MSANVSTHEPMQDEGVERQLYKTMLEIQKTLNEHTKLLHQIINKEVEPCSDAFVYHLPVKSIEELSVAERAIQNDAIFSNVVKHLGHQGGSNVRGVTRSVCRRLLTDEVASHFNWAGRGQKENFRDFRLRSLILYAVKQNIGMRDASVKDIEEAIKDWLKHAPTRLQRGKKLVQDSDLNSVVHSLSDTEVDYDCVRLENNEPSQEDSTQSTDSLNRKMKKESKKNTEENLDDGQLESGNIQPDSSTGKNENSQSPHSSTTKRDASSISCTDDLNPICTSKLRKLEGIYPTQKVIAEKLFSDVIYKAHLNLLTIESSIQSAAPQQNTVQEDEGPIIVRVKQERDW